MDPREQILPHGPDAIEDIQLQSTVPAQRFIHGEVLSRLDSKHGWAVLEKERMRLNEIK